jgi:hypothetical protein
MNKRIAVRVACGEIDADRIVKGAFQRHGKTRRIMSRWILKN